MPSSVRGGWSSSKTSASLLSPSFGSEEEASAFVVGFGLDVASQDQLMFEKMLEAYKVGIGSVGTVTDISGMLGYVTVDFDNARASGLKIPEHLLEVVSDENETEAGE